MVDLAVPRDIEPEVARLSDVYLYTVDDLSAVVQMAGEKRHAAVARAEEIVEVGVKGFEQWMEQRASVPLIRAVQQQAEDWRSAELKRARQQLARGVDVDEVLDTLTRGLTAKLLHGPLAELRGADSEHRAETALTLQRLFLRPGHRH